MNAADIAWMLVSTALVLLMTPALAFFYGGLVRSKNALNTMMMSFAALGAVGLVWALLATRWHSRDGLPFVGGLSYALLDDVGLEAKGSIPHVLFMSYQGTFAIITVALISGAIVERMRFVSYLLFLVLWTLVVYAPVAHWVWGGGWLAERGRARLCGRHGRARQRGRRGAGGGAGPRPAPRLRPPGVPAAQRPVHAAGRRTSLVRLVRLQRRLGARRQPARGAGAHEHAAGAGVDARGLDDARPAAHAPGDRGGRRDRDRRRPRGGHSGRRLHQPAERHRSRARSPRCRVTSRCSCAREPGWTIRSTSSAPTVSVAPSVRC